VIAPIITEIRELSAGFISFEVVAIRRISNNVAMSVHGMLVHMECR
jgi:hypothetical protein